jgi:prevent-host-death family protein
MHEPGKSALFAQVHFSVARTARSCDRLVMARPTKPEPLTLSVFRTQPGEYVREVARNGKRYLLTKAGKPVALLIPVDASGGDDV